MLAFDIDLARFPKIFVGDLQHGSIAYELPEMAEFIIECSAGFRRYE
jgi:hypothetical protein